MPLTERGCRAIELGDSPKKYADGRGLYLLVNATGKYWRWDYRFVGKRKTMALGVFPEVSLAAARDRHAKERSVLTAGIDPMQQRVEAKHALTASTENTFASVAAEWYTARSGDWQPSTAKKVAKYLDEKLNPGLGTKPISRISTEMVVETLEKTKSEEKHFTASRLREICSQIVDSSAQLSQ